MKKSVLFLFCILYAAVAFGQNAQIKVQYKASSPFWMTPGETSSTTMLLLSGPEYSRYFNTMSQYVDSMTSTPEGKKRFRKFR